MPEIVRMDWLAENVIGSLPDYEAMNDTGRRMADFMGVGMLRGGA